MRLKSKIWIQAYIRRCFAEGASAVVVQHGDDDAGSIFIRINLRDGTSHLYGPAPAGWRGAEVERTWVACFDGNPAADSDVDAYIARQAEFDDDLWVIEIEDSGGQHFLDDWLA